MTGHLTTDAKKPSRVLTPLFLSFGQATGRIGDAHEANVYTFFAWTISACPSHRDAAANGEESRGRRQCSFAASRNLLQSARDGRRPDYRRGNPDFTAG